MATVAEKEKTERGEEKKGELVGRQERAGLGFPSFWGETPFPFIRRFAEDMERMFEDFRLPREWLGRERAGEGLWSPRVDVFDKQGELVIRADLPGLTKDDVKVEVTDKAVAIEGERREHTEDKGAGYYRNERTYGSFYREIPLPPGCAVDQVEATFKNGVLEIKMPAPERREPKGRKVDIRTA